MKIKSVRTMVLTGQDPHGMGGEPRTWNVLLVRVDADNGLYGIGEAPHWQRGYFGVREAVHYIGDRLVGKSPFNLNRLIHEHFYGALPPHKPRTLPATVVTVGPIVWAMSGVEMALLDLTGKALNTPVYNLLGGKFRDAAAVYVDRSAPSDKSDLEAWRELARGAKDLGFKDIKFDIDHTASDKTLDVWNRSMGTAQIMAVVERLSVVREEVGWDMSISVDCHMSYDIPTATSLSKELEHLKLKWMEDPSPIMNQDATKQIKDKSPIPICVGEMFTADQFQSWISNKACDVVHPDVLFCGGLTQTLRVAQMANLSHLPTALHNNSSSVGVIAAAHVALAIPNFIGMEYHFLDAKWVGELAWRGGRELIEDGNIVLTDEPGLGFLLNEEACEKHLAKGEVLF
jgi:L-alanine-DL-glutamate epimerase-like enolase superfamily enzyme